ncbi:MAG: hypothetical protein ABIH88_02150 [Patescibacteria group bacterium]
MTMARSVEEAKSRGIPRTERRIDQEGAETIQVRPNSGVEVPTSAFVAYSGKKPQFVGRIVGNPNGSSFEFRTRQQIKRRRTNPVKTTLLTLKIPSGCQLLCEIQGRSPIVFFVPPIS